MAWIKLLSSIHHWRVVFAKFLVCFLSIGIYKAFGVLLSHLVNGLQTDVPSVGWGYGLFGGLIFTLGPVAGALSNIHGARAVVITGGVVAATGLVLSSMVTSPLLLGVTLTISGIGHGLALLPSVQPIAFYFRDGFALANGIALGGASIGMMVIPPLTEYVLKIYGWRGTLLILGAIDFHMVVAGALMRIDKKEEHTPLLNIKCENIEEQKSLLKNTEAQHKSLPKEKRQDLKNKRTFLKQLAESLDVTMFRDKPMIIFYDIIIFLFGFVYSVWTVFLVPHAIARGVDPTDAAFLSTISGWTNFLGRVLYAPIIDRNLLDSRDMFAIVSVVNAILFLTDPLFDTYFLLATSASVAGFTIGAGNSLWTVMIKQFVAECETGSFISTLGWACLSTGVATMISAPISGWFYETFKDYDLIFQIIGTISAVMFMSLFVVRLRQKHSKQQLKNAYRNLIQKDTHKARVKCKCLE